MQDETTILLVEDALDLARLIQRELQNAGYRVLHAAEGRQALSMQREQEPDLIILDWMLPGMDGLEVLRHIRQNSPVPVLMLTARSQEIDRVLGLEVGADDYLTKPFSTRELVARVHALLRRIQNVRQILSADRERHSQVATYGSLVMEPEPHQARLDDQFIEFTRTEFDLLYLLVQNPGRVFSRAYLLETVWDERYVSGDRSVDNMILRLRKKLGDLGERIETVWGVGYRLKSEP